jgi:hypothetical protein
MLRTLDLDVVLHNALLACIAVISVVFVATV